MSPPTLQDVVPFKAPPPAGSDLEEAAWWALGSRFPGLTYLGLMSTSDVSSSGTGGSDRDAGANAPSASSSAPSMHEGQIVREISLEEFNPVGTLAVNGMYFILLLFLYALMYFVEFAGRGPSIIG